MIVNECVYQIKHFNRVFSKLHVAVFYWGCDPVVNCALSGSSEVSCPVPEKRLAKRKYRCYHFWVTSHTCCTQPSHQLLSVSLFWGWFYFPKPTTRLVYLAALTSCSVSTESCVRQCTVSGILTGLATTAVDFEMIYCLYVETICWDSKCLPIDRDKLKLHGTESISFPAFGHHGGHCQSSAIASYEGNEQWRLCLIS